MYFWKKSQKEYFVDRLNMQNELISGLSRTVHTLSELVYSIQGNHNNAMKAIDEAIACKHHWIDGHNVPVTTVVDAIVEYLDIHVSDQLKVVGRESPVKWDDRNKKKKK